MACKYFYNKHKFNSEIELDDFLISDGKLVSKLGDIVFNQTSAQNHVASQLHDIEKGSKKLQDKYREWKHSDKIHYNENGEELFEDPPYIGVNKFLSGLKNSDGKFLFPEFREEAYWENKTSEWKEGIFTEEELNIFGLEKGIQITDQDQLKTMRETIEKKWKTQAKIGTAIHSILQIFFQRDKKGEYTFNMPEANLRSYIVSKISTENMKYLTPKAIDDTIKYAKELKEHLEQSLGNGEPDSLAFYPEFMVSQDASDIETGNPRKLFGIIDLLIVDKKGNIHIVDYKTSIHDYQDFSVAKNLAYSYQMATYQRMLEIYGFNVTEGRMMVAPIKIDSLRPEGDTYTYDGITYNSPTIFIDTSLNTDKMWDNIDQFMPAPYSTSVSVSAEQLEQKVTNIMTKWFPSYSSTRLVTEEEVIEELKGLSKNGKIEPDETNVYIYRPIGVNEKPITATSELEFIKKVTKYKQSLPSKRRRRTQKIKEALKEGIRLETANVNFPTGGKAGQDGSPTWLQDTLRKYCNSSWKVVDNEVIEAYGLIRLDNIYTGQIDFVRISHKTLDRNYRKGLKSNDEFKNRNGLTGTYEPDIIQQSKSVSLTKVGGVTQSVQGSLMAEAVNGNVEIMETMLIINQLTGLQGKVVGNIQVINPDTANGMQLSNEQAYYCFRELNKHDAVEVNKFETGEIKLASKYELAANMLKDIMTSGENHEWKDEFANFRNFSSAKSLLDQYIDSDSEDKIAALQKLRGYLEQEENRMKESLGTTYTNQRELQQKHVALYNAILVAIAQLKGVNFRQQIKDHDQWLESIFIWRHGVSGSYLDNPGNLNSDTLNLVTKLVTEAYQNTRDDMQRKRAKVQKLVENLKKSKSFGSIYENTIGNQAALYSDLYRETPEGDLLFKNPKNVSDQASREFLEYALEEINAARLPNSVEREELKNSDDPRYYRVPLALGGSDSVASVNGMMEMLKAKLSYLNPKTAFERARKKIEGIYEAEESTELQQKSVLLYQMTNMFDKGETDPETRIAKIKQEGIQNFERNLESLLLKHMFAYSVKKNVDSVFPMIKAAMIHITMEGAIRNTKFTSDIQYLDEYIRNKILNQSIVDPTRQNAVNWLNSIKTAASKFTLAFAPVQALYQPLQGLWQNISLMIRKPDGKESFTFKHFTKAYKMLMSDLFTNKPTICGKLNELYGINDMDMNTYIDRISSAKKGLWNFENMMFKFAARPDFYNRMSIFVSQMMGDGCLEAHRLNDNGELIYDWKLDKRFDAFANKRTSDPRYNEQKARYYAIARQFVIEHAKTSNGEDFVLNMDNPMPLPRAYTNKEAESMKSLGDDIYGYYSHEKKSMIMSTMIGSMWLQFKTYWSGKKNQYLAPGGVRLRGKWKHYEENGEKYYYQVDENGNILYNEPPITTETIAPVMQWEGQWQEGIIITLSDIFRTPWNLKSIVKNAKAKWNEEDEKLQLAYRSNIKQAGYDLFMFLIIGSLLGALLGDWLDELKEDNKKNKDFITGLGVAAANVAVMSVKNSFLDFNFIDSVGNPVGQWTPFAFEWGGRVIKNWWNVAMGDEDFWDGVVKTSGGLKQIKPVLDTIKPDMFRTEREGGTFNKENK